MSSVEYIPAIWYCFTAVETFTTEEALEQARRSRRTSRSAVDKRRSVLESYGFAWKLHFEFICSNMYWNSIPKWSRQWLCWFPPFIVVFAAVGLIDFFVSLVSSLSWMLILSLFYYPVVACMSSGRISHPIFTIGYLAKRPFFEFERQEQLEMSQHGKLVASDEPPEYTPKADVKV
jgi:hypothetical protein